MPIYCAWLGGVPALAAGLFFTAPLVLAAGAWLLFGAVVLAAIDAALAVTPTPGPARVAPKSA